MNFSKKFLVCSAGLLLVELNFSQLECMENIDQSIFDGARNGDSMSSVIPDVPFAPSEEEDGDDAGLPITVAGQAYELNGPGSGSFPHGKNPRTQPAPPLTATNGKSLFSERESNALSHDSIPILKSNVSEMVFCGTEAESELLALQQKSEAVNFYDLINGAEAELRTWQQKLGVDFNFDD
ncbi:MAG: hypothetical protein LBB34_04065 [Holosporales bacterium]|jgi:hypothetical protein|nr:hypothetical protein [Holosporales bacterium]